MNEEELMQAAEKKQQRAAPKVIKNGKMSIPHACWYSWTELTKSMAKN